jgi:hypothetical protein
MKDKMFAALFVITVVAIVGAALYGMRLFSNATTPITVHEVEPGVKCATMVTTDGAAIDCWKI